MSACFYQLLLVYSFNLDLAVNKVVFPWNVSITSVKQPQGHSVYRITSLQCHNKESCHLSTTPSNSTIDNSISYEQSRMGHL
jgi:hypothetical protein